MKKYIVPETKVYYITSEDLLQAIGIGSGSGSGGYDDADARKQTEDEDSFNYNAFNIWED